MQNPNVPLAVSYYQAMAAKNLTKMENLLHPNVTLISPMAQVNGKEAVFNAVKHFATFIDKLTIRAYSGENEHVFVAYNVECPAPINTSKAIALLTFQDGLIYNYELFYDARPFEIKKEQIFGE